MYQTSCSSEGGDKVRNLIADDHAMIRNALAFLVNAQPDMDVGADAADGHEAG